MNLSPRAAECRLVGAKTAEEKGRASQVDAVKYETLQSIIESDCHERACTLWKGENASLAWSKDDMALSRMGVGHSNLMPQLAWGRVECLPYL